MDLSQPVKSIKVFKQIIRADGTREPVELAAVMHQDPDEMERLIREHDVKGFVDSGAAAVSLLNNARPRDADRIVAIGARQAENLRRERCA